MRLQLIRSPSGESYRASGEEAWMPDEHRDLDALRAQRLLEDHPGCFAVVVDEEPHPETVGPLATVIPAPPHTTAIKPPKRKG